MSGSTDLTPGSRAQLRNVAKIMKAYPNMKVKIGGYTDNVGDPSSNMRLSDGRAKSVMAQLIRFGVLADRLEAEGYGEQHAIADNATAEGRAKNRRTALSIRAR
jgi:outer membrane protein OmpA-like peptidoglycan-associated protein